ncbi:heme exporter protein D [Luteibacter sp. Sphag1AF]|uniref:heme exporter protein CcmD n=1 Tax=Luteibacter sp. Sphag1AF TaxID=2587031 RepID=UPI0016131614|nr:heme exporter protein CcmD [Luteibacter sp. Sphag1AF]MBB3228407.1 heme exporter protein D [Luteibacter sp. Sphag1AF]
MSHFFAMGGYAFYVWTSFAVFFVVLLIDALAPIARRRRHLRQLRSRMARSEARRRPGTTA